MITPKEAKRAAIDMPNLLLGGAAAAIGPETMALAVTIVRGRRRPANVATDAEALDLARAVLALASALVAVHLADWTSPYAADQADRTGTHPPAGEAWLTPREIAVLTLPFLAPQPAPKGPSNGQ